MIPPPTPPSAFVLVEYYTLAVSLSMTMQYLRFHLRLELAETLIDGYQLALIAYYW